MNYRLEIHEGVGSGPFVELDRVTGISQTITNSSRFTISENTTSGVARTSPMLGHSVGTLRVYEILRKVQKHLGGGPGHALSAYGERTSVRDS